MGGQPTRPFSLIPTNPYLQKGNKELAETFRQISRLKYGREREFVEKEVLYRIGSFADAPAKNNQKSPFG